MFRVTQRRTKVTSAKSVWKLVEIYFRSIGFEMHCSLNFLIGDYLYTPFGFYAQLDLFFPQKNPTFILMVCVRDKLNL